MNVMIRILAYICLTGISLIAIWIVLGILLAMIKYFKGGGDGNTR